MTERWGESDWCWGAAIPAPDGFVNPGAVSRTATEEGARHRCEVLGGNYVVVRTRPVDWQVFSPVSTPIHGGSA